MMKKVIQKKECKIRELESKLRLSKVAKGEAQIREVLKKIRKDVIDGRFTVRESLDDCLSRELLSSIEKNSRYQILDKELTTLLQDHSCETKNLLLTQMIVDFE